MVSADTLRAVPLLAGLSDERLVALAQAAAELTPAPGEYVAHEGELPAFYLVLEGRLEITKRCGSVERVLATREAGGYFGDVPLMIGAMTFANARAASTSRILRLDGVQFHELLGEAPSFAAAIARSTADRVREMQAIAKDAPAAQVTIVGKRFDLECHDLRDFLARNQVPYEWLEPDDPLLPERIPVALPPVAAGPLIYTVDGRLLIAPTVRDLADALGLRVKPSQPAYDLIVIGGGPAGLAAAVYGASEGLATLMIEGEAPGGQAGTSSRIENYLGFPSGISGDELGHRALEQAQRLGAEIVVTRRVEALVPGAPHRVRLDGDDTVDARAIVIATGVTWRRLDIPGIDRFTGRGVYYGAARTEARSVRDHDVFLIGGGNSAGQAAVFFSAYARSVTILVRGPRIEDTMSSYLVEQLHAHENVQIETSSHVVAVDGDDHLETITVRGPRGEERRPTGGLFVFIGADAETEWLPDEILRDDRGYVLTGRAACDDGRMAWPLERDPFILETSVPSIFAAGDVRNGSIKRVAAAVGEGSMAIAMIHQALAVPEPTHA